MKYLRYDEPAEGLDTNGNPVTVNVISLISIDDAINMRRKKLKDIRPFYKFTDEQLIEDFKTVYWAWEVEVDIHTLHESS